jgi:sugar phosphate isomerase/epimerase
MKPFTRRQMILTSALAPFLRSARTATLEQIRLGITSDEIDEDLRTAAIFIHQHGLRYAELRSIWGKYNTAQPLEKVREAKALLDEYQLKTSIADTALFKNPLPPDTREGKVALDQQWTLLDDAMERAKILGVDKLRIFAFTYSGGGDPDKAAYPRIYDVLREAARRAKARGLRLAVENVADSYVWTGAQSADLLKAVKNDNLGVVWDPNNAASKGETPFPDGFRLLDPARIFHVHVRDFRHRPDGKVEWAAVGQGEFDNTAHMRALLKAGYKETFDLETHWRGPGGKAASTETSLAGLMKQIERV